MSKIDTKVFKSGNSVAVRLPKEMAFPVGAEVTVCRSGDVVTIMPKRTSIKEMIARLRQLPTPGEIQQRDVEPIPERPGL